MNIHQSEVSSAELLFGQEYIYAFMAGLKQIGIHLLQMSYIRDQYGKFVNEDGSEITRDPMRERKAISSYLFSQVLDYQTDLRRFAQYLPQMSSECRLAVQIPVYNEERNIYQTLKEWASQLSLEGGLLNPSLYEINLLTNGPLGYQRDNSVSEVDRFKRDFPNININILDIEFNLVSGNVGIARKLTTDIILQRSVNRPNQKGTLYIESGDGDISKICKHTIIHRIQRFDSKAYLDGLSGQHDFSPSILAQNDYLFFSLRSHIIARKLLSSYALRPEKNEDFCFYNQILTVGWNTAFTAEAYGLIGGYLPLELGEDFDIGRRISIMRGAVDNTGKFIPNTYTIERSPERMESSPRRFIHAIVKGSNAYTYFGDIENMNEVRALNPNEMVCVLPHYRISHENLALFEKELTKQWQFFITTIKNSDIRLRIFHRMMFFLGFGRYFSNDNEKIHSTMIKTKELDQESSNWNLDYHISSDGNVTIDNIGNIRYALDLYRQRQR